jgi:hypothetical protein
MLAYPVLSLRSVGPCRLLVSRLLVGTLLLFVVWLTGELSPTPGIPVVGFVATDGCTDVVGCQWFVDSVVLTDGHDGTVRFLFIVGVLMVILTLSAAC